MVHSNLGGAKRDQGDRVSALGGACRPLAEFGLHDGYGMLYDQGMLKGRFKKGSPIGVSTGLGGVIEVRGILGSVVSNLGSRIVGGEWAAGDLMTREADLIEEMGVSRSVIREALRILGAKGLIRSRTSDGTRITPRREWRLLDPDLIDWRIKAGDKTSLLKDLMKVRLVLEPSVVYNATLLASDASRATVTSAWQAKVALISNTTLSDAQKRAGFIETDLAFHREFLSIVGSELLDQLYNVIEAALVLLIDLQMCARGATTRLTGMEVSHRLHEQVYDAFEARDASRAQTAMRELIENAIEDAFDGFRLLDGEIEP